MFRLSSFHEFFMPSDLVMAPPGPLIPLSVYDLTLLHVLDEYPFSLRFLYFSVDVSLKIQ
jgi:hypothetical protein